VSVRGIFVGRSTLDVVYACPRFPEPDGKLDASSSYMSGGGPALNAAAAFAGLGGSARLCSVIGEGLAAEWVRQDVAGCGVEIVDAARGQRDLLPISTVILSGASRAIVNQPLPARSRELDGEILDAVVAAGADVVLSDGHLPELALPILRWARGAGVSTVLDGGSWKPWTAELLEWIDIAIVSSRFRPPAPAGGDALAAIAGQVRAAAVTNGAGPIQWTSAGASGEIRPPAVAAIDTLGAGDVFHGAFCHQFAVTGDFAASLASAADRASRSCTVWGAR
jgi:sugar/nucleoside kinase (ribokinase family)